MEPTARRIDHLARAGLVPVVVAFATVANMSGGAVATAESGGLRSPTTASRDVWRRPPLTDIKPQGGRRSGTPGLDSVLAKLGVKAPEDAALVLVNTTGAQTTAVPTDVDLGWLPIFEPAPQWKRVVEEIDHIEDYAAGWRQPGTLQVSEQAASDARALAHSLATAIPGGYFPMVGADDDGYVVFTWHEDRLIGNLSVKGDGRFTCVVERDGEELSFSRVEVRGDMPTELITALTV